jgi:membrane fusion protein, multidrug efflux system
MDQDSDEAGRDTSRSGTRTWIVAVVAAVVAGGAGVLFGQSSAEPQWPTETQRATSGAAAVAAAKPEAAPAPRDETVRGVVSPAIESTVASRMTARITAMPYGEGQSFPAGALLARFDCSQIAAELKAARAAAMAYRKTYDTNVELDQYEAVGKNDVAVSRANLGKAEAEANAVSAQLSDCQVTAPFAGKVVEQLARAGEVAASGQPLLKFQSGRDVELDLIVPSRWLTWLEPGAVFGFRIDETGNTIRGRVKRFGAAVDPVSKTIRVVGVVTESEGLVLAGMSGTATFDDSRAKSEIPKAASGQADGQRS